MNSLERVSETQKALERGWAVTPLRGKVPILPGWQNAPRLSVAQAIAWARAGNVGLRTGAISGLVVVDVDTAKGADLETLELPPTVTVITGSGGLHLYFRHPGGTVHNSAGRLAPHVDVRGDFGQAVYVGSVHPDTGRAYRWAEGLSPEDRPVAPLPKWVLRRLAGGNSANTANIASRPPNANHPGSSRYGQVALSREALAVQTAGQGNRNDRLNRAAFSLARLVARGQLSEQEVFIRLSWAADACGLPPTEATRTIRSGLTAGARP